MTARDSNFFDLQFPIPENPTVISCKPAPVA